MYFYWFLHNLFMQNQNAILGLPSSVKTIMMVSIIIFMVGSILSKAKRLLSIAIIVAVVYFGLALLGVI